MHFPVLLVIFFVFSTQAEDLGLSQCGENEIFTRRFRYEPNCAVDTPIQYQRRCICKRGYSRDGQLGCIPTSKCPKCAVGEYYTYCSNPCPVGAQCFAPCLPGCICLPGYVRSKENKCVEKSRCPNPNEIYTECINPCPPGAYCFAACIPGCVCEEGFERNDKGVCVQKNTREDNGPIFNHKCHQICDENGKCVDGPCELIAIPQNQN